MCMKHDFPTIDEKCSICGSPEILMQVTTIPDMQLSFEGMTFNGDLNTITYCNECFKSQVWNAPRKPQETR